MMPSAPSHVPTIKPSTPTGQPTTRPTSEPTERPAFVQQIILGVVNNTAEFQTAFIASILSVLPSGCAITITSIEYYYDDGTTSDPIVLVPFARRRLLKKGNPVTYNFPYSSDPF